MGLILLFLPSLSCRDDEVITQAHHGHGGRRESWSSPLTPSSSQAVTSSVAVRGCVAREVVRVSWGGGTITNQDSSHHHHPPSTCTSAVLSCDLCSHKVNTTPWPQIR